MIPIYRHSLWNATFNCSLSWNLHMNFYGIFSRRIFFFIWLITDHENDLMSLLSIALMDDDGLLQLNYIFDVFRHFSIFHLHQYSEHLNRMRRSINILQIVVFVRVCNLLNSQITLWYNMHHQNPIIILMS